MKQDSVRPPAGLPMFNHHAGLRIDHGHFIAKQHGDVKQTAVRCNIANKICRLAIFLRHEREGAGQFQLSLIG